MKTKALNVVFLGGGSPRVLPIVRAAFDHGPVFDGGEIRLVDRDLARAGAVGHMIRCCPEFKKVDCNVTVTADLDQALDGADVVYITMAVGRIATSYRSLDASLRRGFISSDNVSLSGAFYALTAGPAILSFARRMEKRCPDAMMLIFANPVAVYSGMVNNHTKIRALGICAGFVNHRWDLTRLLYGEDVARDEYDVDVAGINHLSFILRGTHRGQDLFKLLDRRLEGGYKPARLSATLKPARRGQIDHGLRKLAWMHKRLGTIIFSTEWDGMAHLFHEEMFASALRAWKPLSKATLSREVRRDEKARVAADARFQALVNAPPARAAWNPPYAANPRLAKWSDDVSVTLLKALAGLETARIVASAPQRGAVEGFKPRTVMEFSQLVDSKGAHPAGRFVIPDTLHPLITALATHQTLVGDAIATEDPRVLADALFAYPVQFNTDAARELSRELLAIHKAEIPAFCQAARPWLA